MAKGPDLSYTQGDSTPIRLRFKDKGTGQNIDLTGYTAFFLTIDPAEDPPDGANNMDSMPGALISPETDGLVDFRPSGADETAIRATSTAYPVNDVFYDVQAIDGAGRRVTLLDAGGKFKVKPQINHA